LECSEGQKQRARTEANDDALGLMVGLGQKRGGIGDETEGKANDYLSLKL
jgi:hypothetical protein